MGAPQRSVAIKIQPGEDLILIFIILNTRKNIKWIIAASILVVLLIAFVFGPAPGKPKFNTLFIPEYPDDLKALEDSLVTAEHSRALKPDNQARIIWEKPFERTPWSIVYLHGNGASQEEGDPIHEALAHRYGCNLFLSRLAGHGLATENPMLDLNATEWIQSALDAIAIGEKIGEKVLVISTSTGSTLDLYLSARYPEMAEGHIFLSPNIDLYDPRSFILTLPYGLHIARMITGSKFYGWEAPEPAGQYWYTRYRVEGLVTLKSLINATMREKNFADVTDPVLLLYYYKDDAHQDDIVSVKRMQQMFSQLGTATNVKKEVRLAQAGNHIIGSDLFNHNLEEVWSPVVNFCEEVLKLPVARDTDWKIFVDDRD